MTDSRDKFIAYKVTHRESGRAYVGITTQALAGRWKDHCKATDTYIAHCIRKYGPDAFEVEHIASAVDLPSLQQLEIVLIQQHGTMKPAGFNVHPGGEIAKHTPETIAKMRVVQSNRSPEWRANLSRALTGKKLDEARRAAMMGRPVSQAARVKISAKLTGTKSTPEKILNQRRSLRAWWHARKSDSRQECLL